MSVFMFIDEYDNFARIFMTGVSPIMLDDLTSGFNITLWIEIKILILAVGKKAINIYEE